MTCVSIAAFAAGLEYAGATLRAFGDYFVVTASNSAVTLWRWDVDAQMFCLLLGVGA